MNYTTIHETVSDGFLIRFEIAPEHIHPRELFDDTCHDIEQICRDIDNCRFEWFIAKVSAHKAGVELAADYLGGNLYENAADFVTDNYYYSDMKSRVIEEAKQKINILAEVTA